MERGAAPAGRRACLPPVRWRLLSSGQCVWPSVACVCPRRASGLAAFFPSVLLSLAAGHCLRVVALINCAYNACTRAQTGTRYHLGAGGGGGQPALWQGRASEASSRKRRSRAGPRACGRTRHQPRPRRRPRRRGGRACPRTSCRGGRACRREWSRRPRRSSLLESKTRPRLRLATRHGRRRRHHPNRRPRPCSTRSSEATGTHPRRSRRAIGGSSGRPTGGRISTTSPLGRYGGTILTQRSAPAVRGPRRRRKTANATGTTRRRGRAPGRTRPAPEKPGRAAGRPRATSSGTTSRVVRRRGRRRADSKCLVCY